MTLDRPDIKTHYQRARPVYEALAAVDESPTIGLNDFVGWYIKRDHGDVKAIKAGYPQRGRVARLDRDYDEIIDRLRRTLYAVTTYKTPAAFQRWIACRYDEDEKRTVWQGGPPTPGYADLRAVPAWGDIDLADDLKAQRGSLDTETRGLIEDTLTAYIDEFAELYGTRDAVYALDSVGGSYVFGAPEATLPIANYFNDDVDALERVFDEFLDRSNDWLREAEARVNERISGAEDVIQPDWVNNKNRQYKPPLSLHSDHDAVVTPLNTDDVRYDLCPFVAVDDATIERAVAWAEDLTRAEHTGCVDSLVAELWPELYDSHGEWPAALEAWIEAEREREQERRQQREQALRRREERLEELDGSLEGRSVSPFKQDIYEAVEAVDITEIAREYASDAYNTDPNQLRPQFDPSWRHSESGQSCFIDEQANTFGDSKVNAGGGPANLMALATGIITDARDDLDGQAYWAAVDELRNAGYDIPIWIPEAGAERVDGDTYDQMPFWAVKKAAVALGVCPEDAFIDRDGVEGTYKGFPGYETYNKTLEAIEDADLNHGRESITPDETGRKIKYSDIPRPTADESPPDLDSAHLREKNRLLEAKLERLETKTEDKAERIDDLESEIESLRTELDSVRSERDRLEAALEKHRGDHEETPGGDCDENDGSSPLDRARRFVSFDR